MYYINIPAAIIEYGHIVTELSNGNPSIPAAILAVWKKK